VSVTTPAAAAGEAARLAALHSLDALDAPPTRGLERLVGLAATVLGFPSAGINLIAAEEQWTAASTGPWGAERLPRGESFCSAAIETPHAPLVVPDARRDERFAATGAVADGLVAYAGAPLVTSDGQAVGALCVTDERPRELSAAEAALLEALAAADSDELERTRDLHALAAVTRRLARATSVAAVHAELCAAALELTGAAGAELLLDGGAEGLRRAAAHGCTDGAGALGAQPVGERGVLVMHWAQAEPRPPRRAVHALSVLADEAAVALERAELLARLEELNRTDPLTGAGNRRALDEALAHELARAARDGGPLTLALLDLDHFKAFNDRFGHPAGDRLLAGAVAAWRPLLRAVDTLSRFGGEEFAVLLPRCEPAEAVAILDRLRPELGEGQTFSAGLAEWRPGEDPDALVRRADEALYDAKAAGRACARIAD
jgi:diguanylate cyclase (GGDEF)-like protein